MTTLATTQSLIGTEQIANRLGITEAAVRLMANRGAVPYYRVGRLLRFDLEEVQRWFDEMHIAAKR